MPDQNMTSLTPKNNHFRVWHYGFSRFLINFTILEPLIKEQRMNNNE